MKAKDLLRGGNTSPLGVIERTLRAHTEMLEEHTRLLTKITDSPATEKPDADCTQPASFESRALADPDAEHLGRLAYEWFASLQDWRNERGRMRGWPALPEPIRDAWKVAAISVKEKVLSIVGKKAREHLEETLSSVGAAK